MNFFHCFYNEQNIRFFNTNFSFFAMFGSQYTKKKKKKEKNKTNFFFSCFVYMKNKKIKYN